MWEMPQTGRAGRTECEVPAVLGEVRVGANGSNGVGMAPVSKERVDRIFENYLLALAAVDQCSESAADAVRSRLAANLDQAERLYADAAADGLVEGSTELDAAVRSLSEANERSRNALHEGTPIAGLVPDLEQGTLHAARILEAALQPRG